MVEFLFIRIVLLARGHSLEIRLPRFARDRRVSGRVSSSLSQPLELVHSMICLRRYVGMLSLEKIVGSTVKMQYVRTREAQPHSPSLMTLAGKASSSSPHTINVSHAHAQCWRTIGHSVSKSFEILIHILSLYSAPVTMPHMMLPSKHIAATTW